MVSNTMMNLRVMAACICSLLSFADLLGQATIYFNPGPEMVWEHNGPRASPDFPSSEEAAFAVVHGPGDVVYMLAVNDATGDGLITQFDTQTGTPGWSTPWPVGEDGCAIAMVGQDKIICLGRTPNIVSLIMLSMDGSVIWS